MLAVEASAAWRSAHPGACIGLLEITGVDNSVPAPALQPIKAKVAAGLRERYGKLTRADFVALPVMSAYVRYYKRFEKTYHVLQQVESVALKGKELPSVSPLVDANFAAELETLVLAAGHDVARLKPPASIDVAVAGDTMEQRGGARKSIPAGDMIMRDADAVACSILYGQDSRSPITPQTSHVLYVAYAPAGVGDGAVRAYLDTLLTHVRSFAPGCTAEQLTVISA